MNNIRMMRYLTRIRTMGSIEVYDAKQENGFPTFQTTMHGINILKT